MGKGKKKMNLSYAHEMTTWTHPKSHLGEGKAVPYDNGSQS